MSNEKTKGVDILLGNPERAILKLSLPMMLGMFIQALYNLVDGFWIAGLGEKQLAAIGIFFPLFIVVIALGAGLGVGGGSAVSRKLGSGDKIEADRYAAQTISILLITGIATSVITLPLLKGIFNLVSKDTETIGYAVEYGTILIAGSIFMLFTHGANALLRAEGDSKKAMIAMLIGAVLNLVLDPVFIYTLGMGIKGAAAATVVSMGVSAFLTGYWLFVGDRIYLNIRLSGFKPDLNAIREIMSVGIPSAVSQISMSVSLFMINMIASSVAGTKGVAVFTASWRVFTLGTIPLIGISTGVVSVTGAAFGACNRDKLKRAYTFAIKTGMAAGGFFALLIGFFSDKIAFLFTYSEGTSSLAEPISACLTIAVVMLPFVPMGMFTSAMFRGIGKGYQSLWATVFRACLMQVLGAWYFGVYFGSIYGVALGLTLGNIAAVFIVSIWGRRYITNLPFE
ncbi:MAG: MATE family efflux transporter [Chitinivibrionales bacterium]